MLNKSSKNSMDRLDSLLNLVGELKGLDNILE